jgi:hypothetical protein
MQRALEARHPGKRRNKMADRDTGTQTHLEGPTDKGEGTGTQDQHGGGLLGGITGTVQDTVQGTVGTVEGTVQGTLDTVEGTVQGTLDTVQDTVGDVKDTL